ncbi:unnamed protein product, partial [Diplocarpon coronariae]
ASATVITTASSPSGSETATTTS